MNSQSIIDHYTGLRRLYDDSQPGSNRLMADHVVRLARGVRRVRVLNIGCATTLPLETELCRLTNGQPGSDRIATSGLELTSVDISLLSMRALKNLRRLQGVIDMREGPSFTFRGLPADMRHLPLADNTFDHVVSNLAMDILPGPDRLQTYQEAARVLKPGGTVYAHVHSEVIAEDVRRRTGYDMNHYASNAAVAAEAFEAAGLKVTNTIAMGWDGLPVSTPPHAYYAVNATKLAA